MKIPLQLMRPEFRFFLIGRNKKIPMERFWNSQNNYMFFEKQIQQHISENGNIGIIGGYGGLIVIDFDDKSYQEMKSPLLPKTFTVRTAIKRLNHYYYILRGEMIKKIGIDVTKTNINYLMKKKSMISSLDYGSWKERVCDIQAGKSAIVCPPSKINRKYYSVIDNSSITEITIEKLTKIFKLNNVRKSSARNYKTEYQPEKIQKSVDVLIQLGVIRTNNRHFKCPFHNSVGQQNLYVFDDGSLFCFHCNYRADSIEQFKTYWEGKFQIK